MPRPETPPQSMRLLLERFRPCFSQRGFDTFVALVGGPVAAPMRRTVCGIFTASGMSAVWHHSRAHRFFAATRWNPDQLGLVMLRLIVGLLLPIDAPIVIAIDDTLLRRNGRKAHAACWAYDRSRQVAKGQQKLSRATPSSSPLSSSSCRSSTGPSRWRCWHGCGAQAGRPRPRWPVIRSTWSPPHATIGSFAPLGRVGSPSRT